MKKSNKKIKRRYLINKKYQLGNAFIVTALQIPCILVTAIALSCFYLFMVDSRMVTSCNTGLLLNMGVIILIISAATVWLSIRFTHKVVGPVEKTGALLRDIARGHLPEETVSFRKNDRFKELSKDLNEVIAVMKKKRRAVENARATLIRARKKFQEKDPQHPCIEQIDAILEQTDGI